MSSLHRTIHATGRSLPGSSLEVRPQPSPERADAFELTVSGEVDAGTVPALDHALEALIAAGARFLVLDLAGVTFLDSTGLRSIVRASRLLAERGGRLTCAGLSATARRVLEVSGLLGELTAAMDADQGISRTHL